jgi:hypothetical protein
MKKSTIAASASGVQTSSAFLDDRFTGSILLKFGIHLPQSPVRSVLSPLVFCSAIPSDRKNLKKLKKCKEKH